MNKEDKIMQCIAMSLQTDMLMYERENLIKKHKTMSNKTSKVIVVKRNGYLHLETECGIHLDIQTDLKIKNGIENKGYVIVSADFEIPIDEFKIHDKDGVIEFKIDSKSLAGVIERSKPTSR